MNECKGGLGGIKEFYIIQIPIDLSKVNFMSEFNGQEAKEIKERGGIDCIILSPEVYKHVKEIKKLIKEAEDTAEECFQELEDEEQGELYLSKVSAYKEAIKIITGGKPILNDL